MNYSRIIMKLCSIRGNSCVIFNTKYHELTTNFLIGFSGLAEALVHGGCGTTAVAHGEDDGGSASDDVASGIERGDAGLHLLVDGNGVLAPKLKPWYGLRHNGVGADAYGYHSKVDVHGDGDGAAVGIRHGHRAVTS